MSETKKTWVSPLAGHLKAASIIVGKQERPLLEPKDTQGETRLALKVKHPNHGAG